MTGGGTLHEHRPGNLDSHGNPQEFVRPGEGVNGDPTAPPCIVPGLTTARSTIRSSATPGPATKATATRSSGTQHAHPGRPGPLIPGSVQVQELGADPELWKPEADRERRTAVGVRFTDARDGGHAISAHLTTESINDQKARDIPQRVLLTDERIEQIRQQLPAEVRREQGEQMRVSPGFRDDLWPGGNTILGRLQPREPLSRRQTTATERRTQSTGSGASSPAARARASLIRTETPLRHDMVKRESIFNSSGLASATSSSSASSHSLVR